MKKIILSAFAAAALLSAPAIAADIPVKGPVYKAVPGYNWNGWYGGINAGYGWDPDYTFTGQDPVPGIIIEPKGGFFGFTVGRNWQVSPTTLYGIEADFQFSDIRDSFFYSNPPGGIDAFNLSIAVKQFGTLRGRIGHVQGQNLYFVTGGLAYANFKINLLVDFDNDTGSLNTNKWLFGYVVGAGWERALSNNWTIKFEYLFMDFQSFTVSGIDDGGNPFSLSGDPYMHVFRIGLNTKFSTSTP
jgi:outer membrane immunogenic protein